VRTIFLTTEASTFDGASQAEIMRAASLAETVLKDDFRILGE